MCPPPASPFSEFEPHYLAIEHRQGVVVATPQIASLTEEINLEEFGHELFALVDEHGFRKLVLSLGQIGYMNSSGIGKLITLHRKMHRQHGTVVFSDLQVSVQEILRTSNLHSYFRMAVSSDVAVAELQSPPA